MIYFVCPREELRKKEAAEKQKSEDDERKRKLDEEEEKRKEEERIQIQITKEEMIRTQMELKKKEDEIRRKVTTVCPRILGQYAYILTM